MSAITDSPVSIDFHGSEILTFNVDGVVRVAMKPVCQGIGLQWQAQFNRIRRHPVLSKGVSVMDIPSKGGVQKCVTLPLNKLNGWLFGIDAMRVKPEIRDKLIGYQEECFEVLSNYWQKRSGVEVVASQVAVPIEEDPSKDSSVRTWSEAAMYRLIGTKRFSCSMEPDGRLLIREIEKGAFTMKPEHMPSWIRDPAGCPSEIIPELLGAISQRLGGRLRH